MRKVILWLSISLDGYIARPDGAVDFLFMPKDYSTAPFFASVDTAVMGRKTLDAALRMGGGGSFGGWSMTFYVLSRRGRPFDTSESPRYSLAEALQLAGSGIS
jgi:dihydrofolate reductase